MGSVRKDLFPAYKSSRPPKPEGLFACEAFVSQALAGAGTPLLCVAGLEADDVLAGAVRVVEGEIPVVLATQDKDAEQLVRDATDDGFAEIVVWDGKQLVRDETAVTQRRGVGPRRLIELWALSGDAGDDIPGVPGWKEKTAAKVLLSSPRHTLDDLLKDGFQYYVPETYRAKFVTNRDNIRMAKKLITLRGEQTARHIRVDELEANALRVAESLRNSADMASGPREDWGDGY